MASPPIVSSPYGRRHGAIRTLHLITELGTGGAQTALSRLLQHADRRGFEPTVACLYNGSGSAAERIRQLGITVSDLGMSAKWRADAVCRLYGVLRRERPTILHTWMYHANVIGRLVGRLARVPVIISSRRNVFIGGGFRELVNSVTSPLADRVVTVCDAAREAELARARVPPSHVITIHNGIDVPIRDTTDQRGGIHARRSLGISPEAHVIGSVGRLHPQKDFGTLIAAMKLVKEGDADARLLIVGDGPCRESLERRTARLDLAEDVIFAGDRSDISSLLAAMDVFALASRWEGLPNAVLEAMACGLPVVATGVGGTPELVQDGSTGRLVSPQDPQAMAAVLTEVLSSEQIRTEMGKAGRARAKEHFSIQEMVRRTEALYATLLRERLLNAASWTDI